MLPTFAAFCIGFLYPFFKGAFLSFCKFKLTSQWTWVGFGNYIKALSDSSFLHAFWYTALFAFVSVVFINVLAFTVAYFLTKGIRGSNLFRTVFFMPNLIGGIVLGYIWSMIFDGFLVKYNTSVVLNSTFGFWGLIILICWQQVGYMMIIYIAGLQSIPEDMLRGGRRSTAPSGWQTLWKITIPNMMRSFTICIVPHAHERLQALRPEPRADGRAAVPAAAGRQRYKDDGNARAEHLQRLLLRRRQQPRRRPGEGRGVLHPCGRDRPSAAPGHP